jgi:hypothetical protein
MYAYVPLLPITLLQAIRQLYPLYKRPDGLHTRDQARLADALRCLYPQGTVDISQSRTLHAVVADRHSLVLEDADCLMASEMAGRCLGRTR